MSTAKKFNPKKAVCKHEGCFDSPSTRGYCRVHFLSVLKGKAEGDQKPRAQLAAAERVLRKKPRALTLVEEVALDEVFAAQEADRLTDVDPEAEVEIDFSAGEGWKHRLKKAA